MRLSPLVFLMLIVVVGALTIGAAAAAYVGVRQFVIESPVELPAPPQVGAAQPTPVQLIEPPTITPVPTIGPTPESGATRDPNATPTIAPYTEARRVTILLMGIDQRPQEPGPFRTDTMIVLSIDPVRKTAAMLSIPRDVYIPIPGYGANRINTANYIGDNPNEPYPGGGPALAARTVETLLGIPINHYVRINFQAFNTIVNALGPITVCPETRIFDDQYPDTDSYGVITVEFQPGCQELNAEQLLQYARVRHNAGDDLGRARRQQEVIRAVKDKVLSLGGVAALLTQAGPIWESLRDNIVIDPGLDNFDRIVQLANMAQDIPTINSAVLEIKTADSGQLLPTTLVNGDQVLVPVYEEVYDLVVRLFDAGVTNPANPQASAENATVYVANGAGVDGLAGQTRDRLVAQGFNVVGIGNAEGVGLYGKSEIRVYTGKFQTATYLAQILGLEATIITDATGGQPGVDIELIVGSDLAPQ